MSEVEVYLYMNTSTVRENLLTLSFTLSFNTVCFDQSFNQAYLNKLEMKQMDQIFFFNLYINTLIKHTNTCHIAAVITHLMIPWFDHCAKLFSYILNNQPVKEFKKNVNNAKSILSGIFDEKSRTGILSLASTITYRSCTIYCIYSPNCKLSWNTIDKLSGDWSTRRFSEFIFKSYKVSSTLTRVTL